MSVIYDPRKTPPDPQPAPPVTRVMSRTRRTVIALIWTVVGILLVSGAIVGGIYVVQQQRANQTSSQGSVLKH